MANKIDRELERKVAELTGKQVALEFGTRFSEVSAKTGAGVDEVHKVDTLASLVPRPATFSVARRKVTGPGI